jgi:hypothetical protein
MSRSGKESDLRPRPGTRRPIIGRINHADFLTELRAQGEFSTRLVGLFPPDLGPPERGRTPPSTPPSHGIGSPNGFEDLGSRGFQ